jgi:hypothetical protein
MCSQWTSKQRIRLNLSISALYLHFSVLSPFQRFLPISAFYPHFSVFSPFQRFIPISAFYPHFSVLSPFQFPLSVSVSAIQFQRFIPTLARAQAGNHNIGLPLWSYLLQKSVDIYRIIFVEVR